VTRATRFGAPLPDGGCIGVPAPASAYFNRSDVLRGVEWWESKGYRVKLADGVFDRDDYVAGSATSRARDLMAMFDDDEVDVIHCMQGGFGSAQLLPHLDFDDVASNPKPLIGFSDITALHTALRQRAGLATFYGPGFMGVGDKDRGEFSKQRLLDTLTGDGGTGEVPKDPDDPYTRAIRGGTVTAPLAGGCLWLLMQSMGTPWEIDLDGHIFFFEDVDCPAWHIDGFLVQLAQSGKLDDVAGVVVGDLDHCDWREERPEWPRTKSIEDVLEERLEPLGVPVLYKLPLGHGKHLATIPLGVTATLDADERRMTIDEPALAKVAAARDEPTARDRTDGWRVR
jgi:muramoyltetrapeptide carboxypeptidase